MGLAALIDEQIDAISGFLAEDDPNQVRLLAIADYCREQLSDLPTDGPCFGLIHGDVIPSNILVQVDEWGASALPASLIDRLIDLAEW